MTESLIRLHTFVRVVVPSRARRARGVAALVDARRDRATRSRDAARAATDWRRDDARHDDREVTSKSVTFCVRRNATIVTRARERPRRPPRRRVDDVQTRAFEVRGEARGGERAGATRAAAAAAPLRRGFGTTGVALDGVEVARFARTGRGVRATRDLRVGEVVVSVPDDAVLTVDACAVKKELGEFVGDGDDEAPSPRLDKELLVIAVMCEMCAGKSSAWCEYLETVHEAVRVGHSVLAWDDEQVTALFGTDAWRDAYENDDETLDLPMMTEEHFENVVTLFFKLFPKLASGLSVEALRELHFAATAMVAGYSFTLGDDEIQAMVPFWDMLNHAAPASRRLSDWTTTRTVMRCG